MESNQSNTIISVFPTAIVEKQLGRHLTSDEFNFLNQERESMPNQGNKTSADSGILDHPAMLEIKQFCLSGLREYISQVECPTSPLIPYITQSWLNWTEKGDYHHRHWHYNSFLSGVLYLSNDDSDHINFIRPQQPSMFDIKNKKFNEFNGVTTRLPAKTGTMYIFPSWLEHSVDEKRTDGVKVSLSFNSFIAGEVGNTDEKTLLILPLL